MITKYNCKQVEFHKVADNVNAVKLSSVYDHPCGEMEYGIVNDAILEYMIRDNSKMHTRERRERDYTISIEYDDGKLCETNRNAFAKEETYSFIMDEKEEKYRKQLSHCQKIFEKLTDIQRDRLYVYCVYHATAEMIAEKEGVSNEAIRKSCNLAKHKLKKHMHFLLAIRDENWIELLKSPNFSNYERLFSK